MCVEHTKEPWFLHEHGSKNSAIGNSHGYHITNAKGEIADIVRNVRLIVWEQITEADGRRIVACVNACAGIQTESLESITSGESGKWNTLNEMFKREAIEHGEQRDKLIASLRLLLDQIDHTKGACSPTEMVGACLEAHVIDRVRTTIEEVEAERIR